MTPSSLRPATGGPQKLGISCYANDDEDEIRSRVLRGDGRDRATVSAVCGDEVEQPPADGQLESQAEVPVGTRGHFLFRFKVSVSCSAFFLEFTFLEFNWSFMSFTLRISDSLKQTESPLNKPHSPLQNKDRRLRQII